MNALVSFSVCIPSFHSENRIRRAVDSVLQQNYPFVEIIICDQADTDTSFLSDLSPSIKRIWLEKPSTYNARCELIKAVQNDYFIQLDDDDYLANMALWDLDKIIRATGFADVYMYRKTNVPKMGDTPHCDGSIRSMTKDSFLHFCTNTCSFYNDLLSKCCKRISSSFEYQSKQMYNNEDGYLLLELSNHYQTFISIDRLLYFHVVRPGSISKVYPIQRVFDEARYILFLAGQRGINESSVVFNTANSSIYNNLFFHSIKGSFSKSFWQQYKRNTFVSSLRWLCIKHLFTFLRFTEEKRYLLLFLIQSRHLYAYVFKRTKSRLRQDDP